MVPDTRDPRASVPDSETVTLTPLAAPAEAPTLAPTTPLIENSNGSIAAIALPDYEILSELGRGGMGVVYKARQIAANRLVALKMILAGGHAEAATLARFRSEAQAVARLQHPGIVQVFDVGEHQGLPFFSLEFVDGGSLDKKLNGTPLPPPEAACLVEQVADAIHAAHRQHIIHRDLKPANILLTGDGQPKVTDFGLAKALDVEQGHTATGAIMGTPSYMAPEQAGGLSKEIGPATDVYALGAVLYECLTGRPPFKAATPLDTILQALSAEPVPPQQLQPKVPRDRETICLKCLRKQPGKRYASAAELADDLRRFREGESIRARPVGTAERTLKWMKRRPALASLLTLLLLAVLGLIVGGSWFTLQLDQARRQSEKATQDALTQLERAEVALYANQLTLAERETEAHNLLRSNGVLNDCRYHNWEWRYLRRRNHYTVPLLSQRHPSRVPSVAFSPDGSRLASASVLPAEVRNAGRLAIIGKAIIKVWDAHTGVELLTLEGHSGAVQSVAFSPDGHRLASASADKTVKVWDTDTGIALLTLKEHSGSVRSVVFSPDGSRLASASDDQTVKVWQTQTGAALLTLKGHSRPVRSVAFSPDDSRLASAGSDKTVKVWDARTGAELRTFLGHTAAVHSVVFSPDGRRLASASSDRTVRLWETQSGEELLALKGHSGPIHAVAFCPDGSRLASASSDGTVKVWAAHTGSELLALQRQEGPTDSRALFALNGSKGPIESVVFSPDGSRLASGGDKMVTVWDARAGQEALTLQGHTSWVSSAAFSPDSKLIVSAGGDKTVRVWDARTGIELLTLPGRQEPVSHVSFSPDGTLLAGAVNPPGKPGEIKVWDAHTGVALRSFVGHTSVVHSVAFSPEGSRLASASGDGMVKVWDARTGAELLTFTASQRVNSMCLAFSADGNLLASGADPDHKPGEVKVWDARTGAQLRSLSGHTGGVLSVAFNPDGRQLASAGLDKSVRVWDAHTGAQLHLLKGHTGTVHSVAFNPDGSRLASAGDDRTVRVWEPRTGIALITLGGHHQKVASVAFSPDGGRLASASEDGTVRVWYAGTDVERLPPSTADNTDTAQARRQHEDDWTTIAWHLQQIARARETSDEFALRFHLDHAFTGLREQVYACLEDDDAAGCRHASAILAAVASASDESLQQLRDVIAFPGMDSPAADELLLAWACHKRGQPAEARRWLQRAAVSMERPGLRTVMRLLGGASTGPLAALTQLSDLGNQQVKESTPRSLQSLRREIETLLGLGKP